MEAKDLGPLIDELYKMRQRRLELTREVDMMKAEEVKARGEIKALLETVGLVKASGSIATASSTHKVTAQVEDWDEVYKFIVENDRFDLLQRRISEPAWNALYKDGIIVNGTSPIEVWDISLVKSTRGA